MPERPKRFIDKDSLQVIRNSTDWREVFQTLGFERSKKSTENDWWALSPFTQEKTASFHINEKGWYCHSSGQGGGIIELVQKVIGDRTGQTMNCYEAGGWLIDQGLGHVGNASQFMGISGEEKKKISPGEGVEKLGSEGGKENQPIRQTLIPALDMEHVELSRRGISKETAEYLGCGYLGDDSKSSLAGRMVFQVRGVHEKEDGCVEPVILTHIGRAMTSEQEQEEGKWKPYAGFYKSLELYNINHVLLDERATQQARDTGHLLVVEGCWDVAKLIEAGIHNVVATFGAHLSGEQIERLRLMQKHLDVNRVRFWYDRDTAGREGEEKAMEMMNEAQNVKADHFDWEMTFSSSTRGQVKIPDNIGDVCEFSVPQLQWLRNQGFI